MAARLENNPTVAWLIRTLGPERAFEACMRLGGIRHYVPHSLKRTRYDGRFTAFFSEEELQAFIAIWPGGYVNFPLARRFCINFLHWVRGKTMPEIALAVRASEDMVRRNISRRPPAWMNGARPSRTPTPARGPRSQVGGVRKHVRSSKTEGKRSWPNA